MGVPWQGVFPAATTQFQPDQSLDLPATMAHIDKMIEAGIHGLIMLGTVGENCSLLVRREARGLACDGRHVGGRVPVLSGVAECSTALACRFAADAQKIGVDGLMVLPAMVYKSDPRETIAHFRAVARSTSSADHGLQQPGVVFGGHHARDVCRAGRPGQPGGDQGIVGKCPADHRPEEPVRRSLHSFLRRRRPGAGEHLAGGDGLGFGPGQCVSGREPLALGPRHGGPVGRGTRGLSLVHAALALGHARQAGPVYQAGAARVRARAQSWCVPRGCRLSAKSASACSRSSAAASRLGPEESVAHR